MSQLDAGRSRHDLRARRTSPSSNKAGKARTSVARKLSALRTFVSYLRREELIEHDPDGDGGRAEARPDAADASVGAGDGAGCSRRQTPAIRSAAATAPSSSCSTPPACA